MRKLRSVQTFIFTYEGRDVFLLVKEYKTVFVVSFSNPYTFNFDFHKIRFVKYKGLTINMILDHCYDYALKKHYFDLQ